LPTFGGDHADRGNPDLLVDAMVLIDGSRLRTPTNCQAMCRVGGTVNLPRSHAHWNPAGRTPDHLPARHRGRTFQSFNRPGTDSHFLQPAPNRHPATNRGTRKTCSKTCSTPLRGQHIGNLRVFHAMTGGVKRGPPAAGAAGNRSPTRTGGTSTPAASALPRKTGTRCPQVQSTQCEQTLWPEALRGAR
jgi:hypothetical protein